MITLENNGLEFRFPDVHDDARCDIEFQRTLRLPDDGETYPLPAGLGRFPIRHTDDFAAKLPERFVKRGGVVIPMWQAEAMWLNFSGSYPCAVKIATGKINAVTGEPWREGLNRDPQDYIVLPKQPWLDGYCVEKGTIRQYVAAPMGKGITVEEQITGTGEHGGLQIIVYPMKREAYEELVAKKFEIDRNDAVFLEPIYFKTGMGLTPGGKMRQEVYDDPHDLDVWDQRVSSRCFVTILNAENWADATGETSPTEPVTADQYKECGVPWFDYYSADLAGVSGSKTLAGLKTIAKAASFGLVGKSWSDEVQIKPNGTKSVGPKVRPKRRTTIVREFQ